MSLGKLLFGSASQEQSTSETDQLSLGGSAATSFGNTGSEAASSSVGRSSQSVAFEDVFKSLYGGAGAAAAGVDVAGISGAADQLFSGGLSFLQQLTGPNAGTDALEARLTDTTARDANLGALKTQLGDFFNEQLLPGITTGGVSTGTFGGARDAVEKASAAKAVAGQFSSGAASILSADQAQRDQAAGTLAGLTQSGAGAGISALGDLYGLKAGGATAGLSVQQMLASILGGPTVLGQSEDVASSLSSSFGNQGSQSYGFDYGTSKTRTQSTGKGGTQGLAQAFLGAGGAMIGFGK